MYPVAVVIVLLSVLAFSGCAAPAATPAAAPAVAGPPQVTLSTNPDPVSSAAETELIIDVKDASGQPLTGATVTVTADMAAHSMGALQGPATDQGNGRYATRVPLNMAGQWEVIVEVRQDDAVLATQEFIIPVP
jgi:hypothetical protein